LRGSIETLAAVGLGTKAIADKTILTKNVAAKRLAWALQRKDWTWEEWRKIIFSDESSVKRDAWAKEGRERRRLLVGYLAEGEGEHEREGEEVDARPWLS
jgi:hypothetical protein